MSSYWNFDRGTFTWEIVGIMAMFYGIASFGIFLLEPLFSDRPLDPALFVFSVVCLAICWLAVEVTFQRKYGR